MDKLRLVLLKILLSPFSLLYGVLVWIRLQLYKLGFLKSVRFDLPVISVGNLTVGGTGKSPHIEYLMALLQPYLVLGTLSRGYKRRTSGFKVVQLDHTTYDVGDEPLQFKHNFPESLVAVSENRVHGIPQMIMQRPDLQCVLLDDAFQHVALTPALNILLTDYSDPFYDDYLLPSGRLREWRVGYKRADFVVVTKCPEVLSTAEMAAITAKIKPQVGQKVFFSHFEYQTPYHLFQQSTTTLSADMHVILVSGIAKNEYLLKYLRSKVKHVLELEYPDHYQFDEKDIDAISRNWQESDQQRTVILTTQKDAMRLQQFESKIQQENLPFYVLPIKVAFPANQTNDFDNSIKQFLLDFKV
jgi:tetraacyldisaccharide 4'-kinase